MKNPIIAAPPPPTNYNSGGTAEELFGTEPSKIGLQQSTAEFFRQFSGGFSTRPDMYYYVTYIWDIPVEPHGVPVPSQCVG